MGLAFRFAPMWFAGEFELLKCGKVGLFSTKRIVVTSIEGCCSVVIHCDIYNQKEAHFIKYES